MSTKIKLMRRGKMRQPYYRIVVADSRTKRDGRSIEEIGKYHPKEDPSYMEVDADRVAYWLGVGAQPTDAVRAILRVTGDWQKFSGEPAPEPMRVKAAKPDRRAAFEAATQLGGSEPVAAATTPKKKVAKSADDPAKAADNKVVSVPDSATTDDATSGGAEATVATADVPVERSEPADGDAAATGAKSGSAKAAKAPAKRSAAAGSAADAESAPATTEAGKAGSEGSEA